jgi:glycosyltransferase involved in cell wall biosynthesis
LVFNVNDLLKESLRKTPYSVTLFDQPASDVDQPTLTVLIPTMNEEKSIDTFIDWVFEGFRRSQIQGELLIVDSSDDSTPEIAYEKGARVLRIPRNGLGDAYRQAVPYVKGKYVILGDADCTYDFRDIGPFLSKFNEGHDFVMGSRFKGNIESGSMPFLHRYLGTPATTWLVRILHGLPFSDIHCGMRGITKTLLRKLPFNEPGWEYAPEMVIRAGQIAENPSEVPINFLKEPEGRISHFRRGRFSFLGPLKAGLGSIRVTIMHALDKVLMTIGTLMFGVSTILILAISVGPLNFGPYEFSANTSLVFLSAGVLGFNLLIFGNMLKRLYGRPTARTGFSKKVLGFNFTSLAFLLYFIGFVTYMTTYYMRCVLGTSCNDLLIGYNSRILSLVVYGLIICMLTWIGSIIRSFLDYQDYSKIL